MATITPQTVGTSGTAVTYAAASSGGDSVATATGAALVVKNGGGSSITVTLTGVVACNLGSQHNSTFTVAAGAEEHIPVPGHCIDPSTGAAAVGYSSATSVTVAAIK